MAVWMVRAGSHGEDESVALEMGLSVIGWKELPDVSGVKTQEDLRALCETTYPEAPKARISNYIGQVWTFRARIKEGDLVILPLKSRSAVAIGRITGPYQYRPDLPGGATHARATEWLRTDLPRNAFDPDLLSSLGAFMTVCQIQRNNAEARIRAVLSGAKPPDTRPATGGDTAPTDGDFDLAEHSRDQIMRYIGRKFRGHGLARLVDEVLKAQGYRTQLSAPGPDGGTDIVAGAGPMGFDSPRLCVQVKSSDSQVDVGVLRQLQGVLKNFGAQQGLLVAWGGFTSSVVAEAKRFFFEIRLWDAGDLVSALLEHYDRLPEEVRAELPLQRIWALVPEEE